MAGADYNLVIHVLAHLDEFKKQLNMVKDEMSKTAKAIADEQRKISEAENKRVRQINDSMDKLRNGNQKKFLKAGADMGKSFMGAVAGKIGAAAGIGLVVGATDKLLSQVHQKIAGYPMAEDLPWYADIVDVAAQAMDQIPLLGTGMRMIGAGLGAEDFEVQQAKRAELIEKQAAAERRRQKELRAEKEIQDALIAKQTELLRIENMRFQGYAAQIGANREQGEERIYDAKTRINRLLLKDDEEALRIYEQQLEAFKLQEDYRKRIAKAVQEGKELLAEDLAKQYEELKVLTQKAHEIENQRAAEQRLREEREKAAEIEAAQLELAEARADAQLRASQATSTFSTAGGAFTTASRVGAMNEQKLANRIAKRSQELLEEIAANTAEGSGEVTLG